MKRLWMMESPVWIDLLTAMIGVGLVAYAVYDANEVAALVRTWSVGLRGMIAN
jgi:uncharacterized membrane protein